MSKSLHPRKIIQNPSRPVSRPLQSFRPYFLSRWRCGHFRRVDQAKEGDQKYAITRFTDEVNRLYGVLNNRLYKHKYLAGDQYTIADMICYPWTVNWKFQGQDIEEFKYFKRWHEELAARPAVIKGMAVGADLSTDVTKLPAEEQARIRKMMYNQRARPVPA